MSSRREQQWLPLTEAAKNTPYSAEYLSLLARKKKLRAKKIGKDWHTTRAAVETYLQKQLIRSEIQRGRNAAALQPISPRSDARLAWAAEPIEPGADRELLYLRSRLAHGLGTSPHEEVPISLSPPAPKTPEQRTEIKSLDKKQFATKEDVQKISASLEALTTHLSGGAQKTTQTAQVGGADQLEHEYKESHERADLLFESFINKFTTFLDASIEGHLSFPHKIWRGLKRAYRATVSRPRTLLVAALLTVLFVALPLRFVFGFFDDTARLVWNKMRDAQTVMGFQPGTHANEILILSPQGDISIRGHIETEGQLRSYAKDGVAPIVVDSKTRIENLNADLVDGYTTEEFTLAFVTKQGNVTFDDVVLGGEAEIGKTLLVKGATRLLEALRVDGELDVFGNARFAKSLEVAGPASFEAMLNAADIVASGILRAQKVVSPSVEAGDVAASGEILGGSVRAEKRLVSDGTLTVASQSTFRGFAFFERGLQASTGSFASGLDVGGGFTATGDVRLGKLGKDVIVEADNWIVDEKGNAEFRGSTTTISGLLQVRGSGTSTFTGLSASGGFFGGGLSLSGAGISANGALTISTGASSALSFAPGGNTTFSSGAVGVATSTRLSTFTVQGRSSGTISGTASTTVGLTTVEGTGTAGPFFRHN
ncbi:MAG: hypothetical protein HYU35_00525 [Parcubacteria group bacterium]|nr:hypothetical protein [Parcubacteria group bacterium]